MTSVEPKAKKERAVYSARQKAQAVLALWTQCRRPSEVCRELGVPVALLSHWQARAMEGMLAALEPRSRSAEERGPMLPAKVERLLLRKSAQEPVSRLSRRLTKLINGASSGKEEAPAKS